MLKFKAVAHMLKMTSTKSTGPPDTPEEVRKLLRPMETFQVETASVSDESDVEDVFEDVHRKGHPDPRKSLNTTAEKIQANKIIAELFTDDHKKIMSAMRSDTEPENHILSETLQEVMDVFEGPHENYEPPEEVLRKIADILSDPDVIIESSPRRSESTGGMSYDYMSGVWNMLAAECKGKGFNVTPHNFDVHKQDEPHWLEKPKLSLDVLDKSRAKCERWLSEQQEDT